MNRRNSVWIPLFLAVLIGCTPERPGIGPGTVAGSDPASWIIGVPAVVLAAVVAAALLVRRRLPGGGEGRWTSADGRTVVFSVAHVDVEHNRGHTVLYMLEDVDPRRRNAR